MEHAQELGASERHACQLVYQPRGTQRYQPTQRNDEDALTRAIIALASQYGRYGYRRITIKLQQAGWQVGKDRVETHLAPRRAEGSTEAEAARTACGLTTDRACGCARSGRITFGRTTSSARSRMMEGRCGC